MKINKNTIKVTDIIIDQKIEDYQRANQEHKNAVRRFKKFVGFLYNHEGWTGREIADRLSKHPSRIYQILDELQGKRRKR